MPEKKNQHFVPQFLLRLFSADERSVGTLVLRTGQRIPRASIADQCARDYFYGRAPYHLEEALEELEDRISPILRSLSLDSMGRFAGLGEYVTRVPPSTMEWESMRSHPLYQLREFVYYQHHRTAAAEKLAQEHCDVAAKQLLTRDAAFVARLTEAGLSREMLDSVRIVPTDAIAHVLCRAGPLHFAMLDLAVKFLVARADGPAFVISDNPVVVRNQYADGHVLGNSPGTVGMPARGLQMYLPVSPRVTLAVYDPDVYDYGSSESPVATVSYQDVRILNAMQAENAQACIYFDVRKAPDPDPLREAWLRRPSSTPRIVDMPLRERADGTLAQTTLYLPHAPRTRKHLSSARVRSGPGTLYRLRRTDDVLSFPIRSPELLQFAEGFAAYVDGKVDEGVRQGAAHVH